jgi:thiamine pyrophosphokinase
MSAEPLLLCADGGAHVAMECGYRPDYVIGDLDSVAPDIVSALPACRCIRVDADDTGTDAQKALRHALGLGVRKATLTGFTGRRTDHTLWNISLLHLYGSELELRLVDDYCELRPVRGVIRFRAAVGQKVSLCPIAGTVSGIRTHGLRFALNREALVPGVRDGISNQVLGNPVEISVESGQLLLVIQRQTLLAPIAWERV